MSAGVDRRRVETDAEIRSEFHDSNELRCYEISEAKQKDKTTKAIIQQLDDDRKLDLSVEVDRRRVETDAEIRSELSESNEFRCYERYEVKQKDETAKSVRKKFHDDLKLEMSTEVDRRRSELHESNELSRYERSEGKQ